MEVVPSGAASFGALVVVANLGPKGIVLTGILFLSHPCRGGFGNGGFSYILHYICSEFFYAQTSKWCEINSRLCYEAGPSVSEQ